MFKLLIISFILGSCSQVMDRKSTALRSEDYLGIYEDSDYRLEFSGVEDLPELPDSESFLIVTVEVMVGDVRVTDGRASRARISMAARGRDGGFLPIADFMRRGRVSESGAGQGKVAKRGAAVFRIPFREERDDHQLRATAQIDGMRPVTADSVVFSVGDGIIDSSDEEQEYFDDTRDMSEGGGNGN